MKNSISNLLVAASAAALLPAQTTVSATATAPSGWIVQAGPQTKRLPAGPVAHGAVLTLFDRRGVCYANARTNLNMRPNTTGGFAISLGAVASTGQTGIGSCTTTARAGRNVIVASLRASAPIAGTLLLQRVGQVRGFIDVGDDSSPDALSTPLPIVLGPEPLRIRMSVDVRSSWSGTRAGFRSLSGRVDVTFRPRPTKARTLGAPCGPALDGRFERVGRATAWRLRGAGIDSAATAYFVIGTQPRDLVVPPTGCRLRTDIAVALRAAVTASGRAALKLPVPANLPRAQVRFQLIAGRLRNGAPHWHTSNALLVDLP